MMRAGMLCLLLACSARAAFAQTTQPDPHAGHVMPGVKPAQDGSAEPATPIPPLTAEDRAAAFPQDLHGHTVHDRAINHYVLFDQLERQWSGETKGGIWDIKSWLGGDVNRVWIHSKGASEGSSLEEAEVHVTYGHSFSRWWDVVAGVRQDFRPGPGQTWATAGIQGLAPQWFEVQATLYVSESATTLARFEAEYELLMTNRLVLQPLVELNLYGKSIPERGIGPASAPRKPDSGCAMRFDANLHRTSVSCGTASLAEPPTSPETPAVTSMAGAWRPAFERGVNLFIERNTMTGRSMLAATAVIVMTALSGAALAHPGHEHKIMGTVTMAAADHVMLKDKDGKDATVSIDKDTKVVRAKKAMKVSDVKVGMRIVVTAVTDEKDDKSIAKVIELGPDPATK